jgi:hypothetical protein
MVTAFMSAIFLDFKRQKNESAIGREKIFFMGCFGNDYLLFLYAN